MPLHLHSALCARLLGRGKEWTGPCCPSIAEDMNLVNFGLNSLPVIKRAASKLQHSTQQCAHQRFCASLPSPGWRLLRHFRGLPVSRYCRDHHHHYPFTRLTVFTPAKTQAYVYIQNIPEQLKCVTQNEISFSGQAHRNYNLVSRGSGSLDFCYFKVLNSSIVDCIVKSLNQFQEILSLYSSH